MHISGYDVISHFLRKAGFVVQATLTNLLIIVLHHLDVIWNMDVNEALNIILSVVITDYH